MGNNELAVRLQRFSVAPIRKVNLYSKFFALGFLVLYFVGQHRISEVCKARASNIANM
jgi:hypothetical protein